MNQSTTFGYSQQQLDFYQALQAVPTPNGINPLQCANVEYVLQHQGGGSDQPLNVINNSNPLTGPLNISNQAVIVRTPQTSQEAASASYVQNQVQIEESARIAADQGLQDNIDQLSDQVWKRYPLINDKSISTYNAQTIDALVGGSGAPLNVTNDQFPLTAPLNLTAQPVYVSTPLINAQATTKQYVDQLVISEAVQRANADANLQDQIDQITGQSLNEINQAYPLTNNLDLSGSQYKLRVANPSLPLDCANKFYVDNTIGQISTNSIKALGDPTSQRQIYQGGEFLQIQGIDKQEIDVQKMTSYVPIRYSEAFPITNQHQLSTVEQVAEVQANLVSEAQDRASAIQGILDTPLNQWPTNMDGNFNMSGNQITNLNTLLVGAGDFDATNVIYVRGAIGTQALSTTLQINAMGALAQGYTDNKIDDINISSIGAPQYDVSWAYHKIVRLADPEDDEDAANKQWTLAQITSGTSASLAQINNSFPSTGQVIDLSAVQSLKIPEPAASEQAATLFTVESKIANTKLSDLQPPVTSIDLNSQKLVDLQDGSDPQDAVTFSQLENISQRTLADINNLNSSTGQVLDLSTTIQTLIPLTPTSADFLDKKACAMGVLNEFKSQQTNINSLQASTNASLQNQITNKTLNNIVSTDSNTQLTAQTASQGIQIKANGNNIGRIFQAIGQTGFNPLCIQANDKLQFIAEAGSTSFTSGNGDTTNGIYIASNTDNPASFCWDQVIVGSGVNRQGLVLSSGHTEQNVAYNAISSNTTSNTQSLTVTPETSLVASQGGNQLLMYGNSMASTFPIQNIFNKPTGRSATQSSALANEFLTRGLADSLYSSASALNDRIKNASNTVSLIAGASQLTANAPLLMSSQQIKSVGNPLLPQDAATKDYVDNKIQDRISSADATSLLIASNDNQIISNAPINMGNKRITALDGPVSSQDAANKAYCDQLPPKDRIQNSSGSVMLQASNTALQVTAPLSMAGFNINTLADPLVEDQAANRRYVDNSAAQTLQTVSNQYYTKTTPINQITLATDNIDLNGKRITNSASQSSIITDPSELANIQYVIDRVTQNVVSILRSQGLSQTNSLEITDTGNLQLTLDGLPDSKLVVRKNAFTNNQYAIGVDGQPRSLCIAGDGSNLSSFTVNCTSYLDKVFMNDELDMLNNPISNVQPAGIFNSENNNLPLAREVYDFIIGNQGLSTQQVWVISLASDTSGLTGIQYSNIPISNNQGFARISKIKGTGTNYVTSGVVTCVSPTLQTDFATFAFSVSDGARVKIVSCMPFSTTEVTTTTEYQNISSMTWCQQRRQGQTTNLQIRKPESGKQGNPFLLYMVLDYY